MRLIDITDASALSAHYLAVRAYTEELAGPLSGEDQTVQSMPDVSPTKWHRAHITWFFETFVLEPYEDGFERHKDVYNFLFNSYYEQVGDRFPRAQRGLISRPGAEEVSVYRRNVDARIEALLAIADEITLAELAPLIILGCHHEQQHQELLLMDIKHVLSINPMRPAYRDVPHTPAEDPGPLNWVEFDGGIVQVGKDEAAPGFTFDNEGPRHEALLQPFKLADRLITCGEWLAFMADDGYHRAELWLSEGWHVRNADNWDAPLYWHPSETGWQIHTLSGTRTIDPHEPVCHISFYEADAYATWAKARLATEFEWERAVELHLEEDGHRDVTIALHPEGAGSPTGTLRQMIGDCWEWTESSYRPYPGFAVADGAIGEYNGKFMINQMVLRGGCAFTPAGHVRPTYRNFFPPHTRWQLSGVRLAADLPNG